MERARGKGYHALNTEIGASSTHMVDPKEMVPFSTSSLGEDAKIKDTIFMKMIFQKNLTKRLFMMIFIKLQMDAKDACMVVTLK